MHGNAINGRFRSYLGTPVIHFPCHFFRLANDAGTLASRGRDVRFDPRGVFVARLDEILLLRAACQVMKRIQYIFLYQDISSQRESDHFLDGFDYFSRSRFIFDAIGNR